MALYDYELHLGRPLRDQRLTDRLIEANLVEPAGHDQLRLPIGGHGEASEHIWTAEALGGELPRGAWQVASIRFEPDFERLATRSFGAFTEWLLACAEIAEIDMAYVPPGSDAPRHRGQPQPPEPMATLTRLARDHTLPSAHPVLFVGELLFPRRTEVSDIDYYHLTPRDGVGILFTFAHVNEDGSFDILDPGPFQSAMLRQLRRIVAL